MALTPYDFGKEAYTKGIKRAPASDKKFRKEHLQVPIGKGLKPMKEWTRGWDDARDKHDLKQNV